MQRGGAGGEHGGGEIRLEAVERGAGFHGHLHVALGGADGGVRLGGDLHRDGEQQCEHRGGRHDFHQGQAAPQGSGRELSDFAGNAHGVYCGKTRYWKVLTLPSFLVHLPLP